jgi:hypothetical protein
METEYQGIMYEKINFSTKKINRNFKIKVVGMNNGKSVERLVGVSGLIDEVGNYELVNSLLTRAFNSGTDKIVCKLRRGLKIIFFRH